MNNFYIWEGIYSSFDEAKNEIEQNLDIFNEKLWVQNINRDIEICINSIKLNKTIPSFYKQRSILLPSIVSLVIEKKENMWSIILNEGKYCITRHAFTIANLFKEEAATKKSYKNIFTKVGLKYNQFTDKDTMLSLYGILGALDFNNPYITLNDCNNTVFVSILVRTWITALCLYLPKIGNNNKFTLVNCKIILSS